MAEFRFPGFADPAPLPAPLPAQRQTAEVRRGRRAARRSMLLPTMQRRKALGERNRGPAGARVARAPVKRRARLGDSDSSDDEPVFKQRRPARAARAGKENLPRREAPSSPEAQSSQDFSSAPSSPPGATASPVPSEWRSDDGSDASSPTSGSDSDFDQPVAEGRGVGAAGTARRAAGGKARRVAGGKAARPSASAPARRTPPKRRGGRGGPQKSKIVITAEDVEFAARRDGSPPAFGAISRAPGKGGAKKKARNVKRIALQRRRGIKDIVRGKEASSASGESADTFEDITDFINGADDP